MKKLFAIGLAALLLVAFTVPAMAKVDVGGIIFTDFVYWKQNAAAKAGGIPHGGSSAVDSWSQTQICIPNISRFKARWTNENNVGMYIEFGFQGDYESGLSAQQDSEGLNLRAAYGWWDVTPNFNLRAGYGETMLSQLSPSQLIGTNQGFCVIGLGAGNLYSGRVNQLRFTFKMPWNPKDRFAIALVNPGRWAQPNPPYGVRDADVVIPTAVVGVNATEETTVPRIDVAMPLHFGKLAIYPSAMYATKQYDQVAPGNDDSVTTYALSLGVTGGTGPFTFAAEYNMGENWMNQDFLIVPGEAMAGRGAQTYVSGGATKIADAECMGWWVDLGFKVAPATIHLIYGQAKTENAGDPTITTDDIYVDSKMYGISVPIPVAKTFIIRPELMIYDWGDSNKKKNASDNLYDDGKDVVLGVQFMIVF